MVAFKKLPKLIFEKTDVVFVAENEQTQVLLENKLGHKSAKNESSGGFIPTKLKLSIWTSIWKPQKYPEIA